MEEADESTTIDCLQYLREMVDETPEFEIPEYEFADEHEKAVAELRAYFWLTFRAYDEDEMELDNYDIAESFICPEDNYHDLRKEFAAKGELAEFHRLYLDYCQDLLAVQKKQMAKKINECDLKIETAINELNNPKNKKKWESRQNHVKKLKKIKRKTIESMRELQQLTQNNISVTKRKLRGLGYIGPDYTKKKTTVIIKPTGVVNGKLGVTSKEKQLTTDGELTTSEISK